MRTIRDFQQELAENCGYADEIIWDLLPRRDDKILKDKIKQLIPDKGKDQKAIEKIRRNIFMNVWAQRKYTNGNSVSSIFYVMVTNETDFRIAKKSTQFSCHPVFRCRKCIAKHDSSRCCMIYVDETGRVYQNWKSFVEDNVLPAGTMVSPRRGVYNFDRRKAVILDTYCTPNGSRGARAMNVAQTGSAMLGVGAACVPIAALALPVATPVMIAAGLVRLGVGAFSAVRSALHLADRKKHKQSISIRNSQARASYLGVAGGVVDMAAAGATRLMTTMAAAGKATAGIEILVNGINISTIILSGSGVANGVLDLIFKFKDEDKITTLDVLQLSASLVLFTHSVCNFQLASQISNEARMNSIKSYRETLSNRQRKAFDKLSKEAVRIRGNDQGKMDIIRSVNKIPDRKHLNDFFKINKQMSKGKLNSVFRSKRSTQNSSGNTPPATLAHRAVGILFAANGGGALMDVFTNLQDTSNSHSSTVRSSERLMTNLQSLAITLGSGAVIHLKQYGEKFLKNITDGQHFQDVILSMAENFGDKTFKFLLELTQRFMEKTLNGIIWELKMFIPTESVLYRILKYVLKKYRDLSYEFIASKGNEILAHINIYYLTLNSNYTGNKLKKCCDCDGRYFICM